MIWSMGFRDDSVAIPSRKKLEPPGDIATGFAVHGDMMMREAY